MASKVAGYIGKIEKNGDPVAIGSTAYGVCETAANVAEKVVDMKGFELVTGATVFVKFVHENTAQNPTVNVNETGAKGIISADNSPVSAWLDGAVLALTFDGNNWATSGDPAGSAIDEAISTVSGSLITLTDAADAPVADLTVTIQPVQEGTGDPSPSNVRAISGWDACKVTSAGKNLLQNIASFPYIKTGITLTKNQDGSISVSGSNTGSSILYTIALYQGEELNKLNGKVIIYGGNEQIDNAQIYVTYYRADNSWRGTVHNLSGFVLNAPSDAYIARIQIRITENANNVDGITLYPQMEFGSTATAYEPYNGQTVTIDLGGTRYGGVLDVPTGVLTVDRVLVSFSDLPFSSVTTYQNNLNAENGIVSLRVHKNNTIWNTYDIEKIANYPDVVCNKLTKYPTTRWNTTDGLYKFWISDGLTFDVLYSDIGLSAWTSDSSATMSAWNSSDFRTSTNIVLYYKEPITVQLTPTEVRTILGLNNIWADTGDITSLTYWKVAGEGIAEAVGNASSNAKYDDGQTRAMITQSSETSMVATKDYSEGDLVIIGGQLLRATENIATTTELVIGEDGNVEVVDVETVITPYIQDSGWQTLTDDTVFSGTIYYRKIGKMVHIYTDTVKLASALTTDSVTLATIPSGYRPHSFVAPAYAGNATEQGIVAVQQSNGALIFYKNSDVESFGTSRRLNFSISYFTD